VFGTGASEHPSKFATTHLAASVLRICIVQKKKRRSIRISIANLPHEERLRNNLAAIALEQQAHQVSQVRCDKHDERKGPVIWELKLNPLYNDPPLQTNITYP
jgi:hypothetical protein